LDSRCDCDPLWDRADLEWVAWDFRCEELRVFLPELSRTVLEKSNEIMAYLTGFVCAESHTVSLVDEESLCAGCDVDRVALECVGFEVEKVSFHPPLTWRRVKHREDHALNALTDLWDTGC